MNLTRCPDPKNFFPGKKNRSAALCATLYKVRSALLPHRNPLFSDRRNYIHIRRFQTLPPEILSQAVSFGASGDSDTMRHVRSPRTLDNRNCIRSESPHGTVRLCHRSPRSVENTIRFQGQTGCRLLHIPQIKFPGISLSTPSYTGKVQAHSGVPPPPAAPVEVPLNNNRSRSCSYPISHRRYLQRRTGHSSAQ